MQLVARYAIFAVVATLVNLLTQRAALTMLSDTIGVALAMAAGTATGLLTKYGLDKRWVFFDKTIDGGAERRKFGLYALTGVGTTLIFWGIETAFWLTWHTDQAREFGAVIGLTIGYWIKYNLDRKFVFLSRKVEV